MNNKAFTLVEILIVVIILGILAAIVIPQFTKASEDARVSALKSDLQMIRSQLELYKVQHLDVYPVGTDSADWVTKLVEVTDLDGVVDIDGDFGPYMQKFPKNPFVVSSVTTMVDFGTGTATAAGDDSSHWFFNTSNGKFSPNDGDSSSDGDHVDY